MKTYTAYADRGCVMIGNRDWAFGIPTTYGDGETKIRIYDNEEEFFNDSWSQKYPPLNRESAFRYLTDVEGTFSTFEGDCSFDYFSKGKLSEKEALLCTLHGRYAIYRREDTLELEPMKMAFVKRK